MMHKLTHKAVLRPDAESRTSISSSGSPVKPTLSNLAAHESSMSDESLSFQSAGSESLSSVSSRPWRAPSSDREEGIGLDWFDTQDHDTDSAASAVSAASSSQQDDTSGDSQKAASGLAVLLVRGVLPADQHQEVTVDNAAPVTLTYLLAANATMPQVSAGALLCRFQLEVCPD